MKRAIKVLQLAPLGAGGVTSLILNIDEQLDRNQVTFDYLTFYDRKNCGRIRRFNMAEKNTSCL